MLLLMSVRYLSSYFLSLSFLSTSWLDASAVLFNSLAAVHITAAERMKQVCCIVYTYAAQNVCLCELVNNLTHDE